MRLLALVRVLPFVLAPCAALGQTAPPAAPARAHFERGVRYAEDLRWPDAIRELEAARDLGPTPSVYFNLGLAFRAVGRDREAIAAFDAAARLAGPALLPARRAEIERYVRALTASLARLVVRAEPPAATVTLDGVADCAAGRPCVLDPGRHVVALEAPGYRTATRVVTAPPGGALTLRVALARTDTAARLSLECTVADAAIGVDGQPVGHGRVEEYLRPGRHALEVTAPGYAPFRREWWALPGSATRLRVALADRRSVFVRPAFWAVAAAVLAAGVVATVLVDRAVTAEPPFEGAFGHVDGALTAAATP